MAERPERIRRIGGGTAERTDSVRQADAAWGDYAGDEALLLMEEVVCRESVKVAYKRKWPTSG